MGLLVLRLFINTVFIFCLFLKTSVHLQGMITRKNQTLTTTAAEGPIEYSQSRVGAPLVVLIAEGTTQALGYLTLTLIWHLSWAYDKGPTRSVT